MWIHPNSLHDYDIRNKIRKITKTLAINMNTKQVTNPRKQQQKECKIVIMNVIKMNH